ncbi:MAG: hypothetical protein ABIS71_12315 [Chthoniobacterales bacterium]
MSDARSHPGGRKLILVAIAMTGFVFASGNISAAGEPARQAPGRLIIKRSPNVGPQIVGLEIDGVQTALITLNRRYDAPLAAGPHILTIYPLIGRWTVTTMEKRLIVEADKTYTFTAAWKHVGILLE